MTTAEDIDRILGDLRNCADPRAGELGEELAGSLVGLYGDGLARIVAALGPQRVAELCRDPLVASLLLVHDLHPVPMEERIRVALDGVDADYLGIDEAGVVRLRVRGIQRGCGSRTALRDIEALVRRAAPEAYGIDCELPPPLLQISVRPRP
ncbi:NifU family protein [Actinoplanes sp. TBRC 11911]|uniref:NifU family protein n=1 Tax=Actinoplanes sp. TBRC 11911 TaxID=2729386 RepID=UPI00145F962E|nr:NifU family protein [Actinoplanes sp. TBRC 11911]NMO57769.1 NifU family protein [Actinoplanes sp. TBRC 11911]